MKPYFYQIEEAATLSQYSLDVLFSLAYEGKIAICIRCSEHFSSSITPSCLALFEKKDRLIPPKELTNAAYVKFLMDAHYTFKHGNRFGAIQRKTSYQPLSYFHTDDTEQNQRLQAWFEKERTEEIAWQKKLAQNDPSFPPGKEIMISDLLLRCKPVSEDSSFKSRLAMLMNNEIEAQEYISRLNGYWRIDRRYLFDIQSAIKKQQKTHLRLYLYGEAFPYIAECEAVVPLDRLYIPTTDLDRLMEPKPDPAPATAPTTDEKEDQQKTPESPKEVPSPQKTSTATPWKDRKSMEGIIYDWCSDLNLDPTPYLKKTRAECLQSILELAIKEGCECINGRMQYNSALNAINSLMPTKTRELIREAFGLENPK
ncbi:MAG: hypothetical protein J5492_01930 [Oxalobacter sp.]|nr:hypothetical protein [Oxalobacter sp.]